MAIHAVASCAVAIHAVIFDKDGTLVDFHATWDIAVARTLESLTGQRAADGAAGSPELHRAADAVGFDIATGQIRIGSPLIAESNDHIIGLLEPLIGDLAMRRAESALAFSELFNACGASMALESVTPAPRATELLTHLHEAGVPVGIATNDSEHAARSQCSALGWDGFIETFVGYDSGFGSKPAPGMVQGCAAALDVAVGDCLMVGDSAHDIDAGQRAGAWTVLLDGATHGPLDFVDRHSATADLGGLFALIG